MQKFLLLAGALVFLSTTPVHANGDSGKKKVENEPHELDTEHDLPSNDPSKVNLQLSYKRLQFIQALTAVVVPFHNWQLTDFRDLDGVYESFLSSDPKAFDLLNIHKHRYTPKLEYGPALVNSDSEYKGISDRRYGYCWGFSTMVRFFTVLAFFDENANVPYEKGTKKWMNFYKKKLWEVVEGNATVFPGFKNFRELTLIPEFELELKVIAMRLWETRAVRWRSLPIFKNASTQVPREKQLEEVKAIEERLSRGELPKILFSSLIPEHPMFGMNTAIHSVLVYKVSTLENGTVRLHLWDINFYTETLIQEPKYIDLTPDGLIHYQPWYDGSKPYADRSDLLAGFQLTPENDREVAQQLQSLQDFCSKEENQQYCTAND